MWKLNETYWVGFWKYAVILPKQAFFARENVRPALVMEARMLYAPSSTGKFLDFTRSRGNDLSTPRPESGFPGLRPRDRWCLCALRWKEALEAGVAPPVVLAASHEAALRYVSIEVLNQHAIDGQNRIHKPEPDQ